MTKERKHERSCLLGLEKAFRPKDHETAVTKTQRGGHGLAIAREKIGLPAVLQEHDEYEPGHDLRQVWEACLFLSNWGKGRRVIFFFSLPLGSKMVHGFMAFVPCF